MISKKNQKKIRSAMKQCKVKGGTLNEDQLTQLLVYSMKQANEEWRNFAVAISKGVLGIEEPKENTAVGLERMMK